MRGPRPVRAVLPCPLRRASAGHRRSPSARRRRGSVSATHHDPRAGCRATARPRPQTPTSHPSVSASQAPASVSDLEDARARCRRRRRHDSRGDGAFPRGRSRVRAEMRRPRVGRHRTTSGPRRSRTPVAADAESSDAAADDGSSTARTIPRTPRPSPNARSTRARDWHAVLTSRVVKPSKREIDAISAATQRPRREMGRVPGHPGGGGRPGRPRRERWRRRTARLPPRARTPPRCPRGCRQNRDR